MDTISPDAGPESRLNIGVQQTGDSDDGAVDLGIETTIRHRVCVHDRAFGEYKMNHRNRGYAVIINNRYFENIPKKERKGTDQDLKKMSRMFRDLGIEVKQRHHNATKEKLMDIIKNVAARDYTDCDCFVCVILSYGDPDGAIYGSDGGKINLTDLIEPLKGKEMQASQSLVGKPKIFIVQACPYPITNFARPDGIEDTEPDAIGDSGAQAIRPSVRIPSEADFLIALSSIPNSLSQKGSWFIQSVYEVIGQYHKEEDLLSMMTRVNRMMDEKHDGQIPCVKSMLRGKVFFRSQQS